MNLNQNQRLKRVLVATVLCVAAVVAAKPASAQYAPRGGCCGGPHGDIAIGYSFLNLSADGSSQAYNGVGISAAFNATRYLAGVVDVSSDYAQIQGVNNWVRTYEFGPRFELRPTRQFIPFAEFLVGGNTLSASANGETISSNGFAFDAVAGADFALDRRGLVAVRPEVGYVHLENNGDHADGLRLGTSLVFHF